MQVFKGEDNRCRDRLLKKNGKNSLRQDRPTMYYPLEAPDGNDVYPVHDDGREANWALGKSGVEQAKREGHLIWKERSKSGGNVWVPYTLNPEVSVSGNIAGSYLLILRARDAGARPASDIDRMYAVKCSG